MLGVLSAGAEPLRVATYNPELIRKGPGLLLRDILSQKDPQILAVMAVLRQLDADVLALTAFDYDHDLIALGAFADRLAASGTAYPYRFALRPNSGWASDLDLDGDRRRGGPGDAQGFGYFAGQGGLALLSRIPIDAENARDFSGFLWQDLPGALRPDGMTDAVWAQQRLSSNGHWEVPLHLPGGGTLRLLLWHATPPVFDGPEDRNGKRNHDEAAFWQLLLAHHLPYPPPQAPFILLGDANLDPHKSEGLPAAIQRLLSHPQLQDALADAPLDTAHFAKTGGLRLDYLLASKDLQIGAAGVFTADIIAGDAFTTASRHWPIWADIAVSGSNKMTPDRTKTGG